MYSEWMSLQTAIQTDGGNKSVLQRFPPSIARDVASSVVKNIAQTLGIGHNDDTPSQLKTEEEVNWTMEVICYGLNQPFAEQETIRGCVHIYCEWLSALGPSPKVCVPRPIREDPNRYGQKIFSHLYNIFTPRIDSNFDQNKRQAMLCHKALRSIENMVRETRSMNRSTWESLLKFLLAAADTLLAPPKEKDSIGDQLSERIVTVTYETWLLCCSRYFPTPSLWRTFRDMAANWRHHETVVVQWNRITMSLTSSLLVQLYGETHPSVKCLSPSEARVVDDLRSKLVCLLDRESLVQCWFRFLHIMSNAVDVCRVETISQTPKFLQYALMSQEVIDPSQVDCLQALPTIFFRAMKGVASIVDSFLGVTFPQEMAVHAPATRATTIGIGMTSGASRMNRAATILGTSGGHSGHPTKGAQQRHGAGGGGAAPSRRAGGASGGASSIPSGELTLNSYPRPASSRPNVDSLLHLVGSWLFDAALCHKTAHRPGMTSHRTKSFDSELTSDITPTFSFHQGQAEACAALARVFCSVRTGEIIQPVYIARFYLVLRNILSMAEPIKGEALSFTFLHLSDLFRLDLRGVTVLIPNVLSAVALILNSPDASGLNFRLHGQIPYVELRRAAISLLLSMICVPLHHGKDEWIRDFVTGEKQITYWSLKAEISEILLNALMKEKDTDNTVQLLGGLSAFVEDIAAYGVQKDMSFGSVVAPSESPASTPHSGGTIKDRVSSAQQNHGDDFDFGATAGIFNQAASLVCAQLMSSWRSDYTLTVAALEVLLSLCKIRQSSLNTVMCKRTIKWLCDLITYFCHRPPTHQSRDLNSMIVATFNCISHWLVQLPLLMQDQENLFTVLEVIELGISGKTSQMKRNESPQMKGEKDSMPVSLRVKNAAEALLGCLIEHVDSFPNPSGAESLYSALTEKSLPGTLEKTTRKYYALGNSTLLTFLEEVTSESAEAVKPSKLVIRGPFGHQAWSIQIQPGSSAGPGVHVDSSPVAPQRPKPRKTTGPRQQLPQRCFPLSIDHIPLTEVDTVLPTMADVEAAHKGESEALMSMIQSVKAADAALKQKLEEKRQRTPFPDPDREARPARPGSPVNQARLFLSHYGFLDINTRKDASHPRQLISLDSNAMGFDQDLSLIDQLPNRTCDTVYLYYVRRGQTSADDIIKNTEDRSAVNSSFIEFLLSLGWPVNVHGHPGWTGNARTSWNTPLSPSQHLDTTIPANTGGSAFDGEKWVLYWADVRSEVAFVVPTKQSIESSCKHRAAMAIAQGDVVGGPETSPPVHKSPDRSAATSFDVLKIVVWLEQFEDRHSIPLDDLLLKAESTSHEPTTPSEYFVIFVHPLETGLLRIGVEKQLGRYTPSTPLMEGMVVSRRAVGSLVRHTALNISNRKRVDADLSQVPHSKRLLKIQEFTKNYGKPAEGVEYPEDPEFFFDLFQ